MPFSGGASPAVGRPDVAWVLPGPRSASWDVDWASGRVVAAQLLDPEGIPAGAEVRVIVNWFEQLRELTGGRR